MAKGDKQDVARAKSAVKNKMVKKLRQAPTPYATGKASQVYKGMTIRNANTGVNSPGNIPAGSRISPAKARAIIKAEKIETNKFVREMAKRGVNVGGSGSVSARKPSMPVKTGAKNKIKAQGAKSMLSPTSSALERAKAKNKK